MTRGDDGAHRPTICLTMIVRNEAHIVHETLESVLPHIDTWSIVDTGSTDGTQDVIRTWFAERSVPGTLHERPWVGFAHNRTEALELARGTADYSLMIDADDLLHGSPDLTDLTAPGYLFHLRGANISYWRPQLFSQVAEWRYLGPVHEYAVCADGSTAERLDGDYHVEVRHLGDRNVRGDKYERDAELLRAAIDADPDDSRSVFYLAQTCLHAGDPQAALDLYTRRISMGGWDEEIHYAHLQRAKALADLEAPEEQVLAALLDAWNARPTRNEALVEIARIHRAAGRWAAAHLFAKQADEIEFPESDLLFVSEDSHFWQARDERAIAAFYIGLHRESFDLCNDLLAGDRLPDRERDRVLANREYAANVLLADRVVQPTTVVERLSARMADPTSTGAGVTVTITTCKRRELFERTMASFLSNCTDVDLIDRWICIDDGSSAEDLELMRRRFPFFEFIEKSAEDRGHDRSMQRLMEEVSTPYWLHLEDDWRFIVRDAYVGRGLAILEDDPTIAQALFNRNYAETLEDRSLIGGELVRPRAGGAPYRVHTHFDPSTPEFHAFFGQFPSGSRGCIGWPHFSLRPSLMRTESVRSIGSFPTDVANFELEFAHRFTEAGLRSAFFDTITCLHIGPLTTDRGARRRNNAYDLNRHRQFDAPVNATIRLVSNWALTEQLHADFERQSMGAGRWNGLQLVDDEADADHTVVLNHPGPQLVDPTRSIVLHMEPDRSTHLWGPWTDPDPRSVVQFCGHRSQPNVAEWHLDATWAELGGGDSRAAPIVKTRDLSTVTSYKETFEGHRLRVALIRHLVASGVPIDVYGAGAIAGVPGHRGALPERDKRDGLFPYRYTFAAENSAEHNYVTEKLFDGILAECLTFYWGCPNISELVDPDAYVVLPIEDLEESRRIIERSIADNLWEQRLPAIRAEKQRILDEYQLFPTIERALRGAQMLERLPIKVLNLDRRPDRLADTMAGLEAALDPATFARVERVRAVDGLELEMTPEIEHTFRGNDFHFRRGIIGCALSHLGIWRGVVASRELTLVLEDDIRLIDDFRSHLIEALAQLPDLRLFDMAFLGSFPVQVDPERNRRRPRDRWSTLSWSEYGGGTFGYLITPHGASNLLRIAERDGVTTGIDWLPRIHPSEVHALESTPELVMSDPAFPGLSGDSDIQHDWTPVADDRDPEEPGPR